MDNFEIVCEKPEIKIYHANCLDILKEMPNESIDLVFTDPPYNISQPKKIFRDYRSGKEANIKMDFGSWDYNFEPESFLVESKRLLNEFGSVIVWTSEQLYGTYCDWFEKNMYHGQLLIYLKSNPLPQFRLVGYRQATELMFWALKNKNTKKNPNFIFLTQREMTNVFRAPIVGGKERCKNPVHPTQKPLSITKEIIRRHCRENGTILDPFMGSGTTLVAAKMLNRNAIGIEIDKQYYELAKQRISNAQSEMFN